MNPMLFGLLRHVLTMAGGYLVAKGYVSEGDVETIVGATIALAGVAWSAFDKRGR
jgi:hypothetical protein